MRLKKVSLLSEYSDEELIKEWEVATEPGTAGKNLSYAQDYYTSSAWLGIRDEIRKRGLDKNPEVTKIDVRLLRNTLKYGAYGNMEEEEHPLEDWWWHLDEIAKKQYPPEKLPEHLRKIYLKHL